MKKSLFQFITIIPLALLLCLSLRGGNMCEAPDKCPICGSGVLDHDDTDMEEKTMDVRVICIDCGWIGHKIYNISFYQLLDNDGNIMEVK